MRLGGVEGVDVTSHQFGKGWLRTVGGVPAQKFAVVEGFHTGILPAECGADKKLAGTKGGLEPAVKWRREREYLEKKAGAGRHGAVMMGECSKNC
jgi:hypothetical protein